MPSPRIDLPTSNKGNLYLRVEYGKIMAPAQAAAIIENFSVTSEGTLMAVRGPCEYLPDASYTRIKGICHALLHDGTRDVTLIHDNEGIYEFRGWTNPPSWRCLIGPSASSPLLVADLPGEEEAAPPTQFIIASKYIIIIPQFHGRAYIYDGFRISALGFTAPPAAPCAQGPTASSTDVFTIFGSDSGFNFDGTNVHSDFGYGRLGTIGSANLEQLASSTTPIDRILFPGAYSWADQYVSWTNDLSPISGRSNVVSWHRQQSETVIGDPVFAEARRKFAHLSGLSRGPNGTIGHNIYRTKDTVNSGDNTLYLMPNSLGDAPSGTIATITDNEATDFPDNAPDHFLYLPAMPVDPFPPVRLGAIAFGRAWYIGIGQASSTLYGTYPGRYGTIDPAQTRNISGKGEVSALFGAVSGLLVFTKTSLSLLSLNEQGDGFKLYDIHQSVGCIAQDSVASLSSGAMIWLALDGFYTIEGTFTPSSVRPLSEPQRELIERINFGFAQVSCAAIDPSTREYRCWVPIDSSRSNNFCFVYREEYLNIASLDPAMPGWGRRTGTENPSCVCVTQDHRKYTLAGGQVASTEGVWVLDHETVEFSGASRSYVIETAWINAQEGPERAGALTLHFLFREWSRTAVLTIKIYVNGRYVPINSSIGESITAFTDENDLPSIWGTTAYGTGTWVKRKLFWASHDIHTGGVETFKIRLEGSSAFEFAALMIEEQARPGSGRVTHRAET